jgi:hypothetical protein
VLCSYSRHKQTPTRTWQRSCSMHVQGKFVAAGALVHQSKIRITPGSISSSNSRYLSFPASLVVGGTWVGKMQVRDAYNNVFRDTASAEKFTLSAVDINNGARAVSVRSSTMKCKPVSLMDPLVHAVHAKAARWHAVL